MAPTTYDENQVILIVVVSVCLLLSTLSVILRYASRRATSTSLWWDDWLVLIAWFFSTITDVFIYISIKVGLGQHVKDLSQDDMMAFGLTFWLQELSWTLAMGIIVPAILLFYHRLFSVKGWLRKAAYTIGAITISWTIMTFLVLVFQCTPVQYFWNRSIGGGTCIQGPIFYFINGFISMFTLFVVLLLPLPVLWKLQISYPKRIGLIVSFTIGTFVCAMSVARLIAIRGINDEDLPWSSIFPGMWSCVECNIAVVSACIPSFTPLIRSMAKRKQQSSCPSGQIRLTTHIESKTTDRQMKKSQFGRLDSGQHGFGSQENFVAATAAQGP